MNVELSRKQFIILSEEVQTFVRKNSYFQRHGVEITLMFLRFFFFAVGFFIFIEQGIFYKAAGLFVMMFSYGSAVITGTHETSHGAFFESKITNKIACYFFADFLINQSSLWWHNRHVEQHHTFTNVQGKDPPLYIFPNINKYVYFFLLPYLLLFWFVKESIQFLWKDKSQLVFYLLLSTAGWTLQILLFHMVLSLSLSVVCVFIMRLTLAPLFMQIAVFNHIGLEEPAEIKPWLPLQVKTTRNVKKNFFINGFGGNAFIDCHLEHHLFPRLSNRMIRKIKPIILRAIAKAKYSYVEESYFSCLKTCLRYYDRMFTLQKEKIVK